MEKKELVTQADIAIVAIQDKSKKKVGDLYCRDLLILKSLSLC